jgi:hypothetical protein
MMKALVITFILLTQAQAWSSEARKLVCSNPTKSKVFTIGADYIALNTLDSGRTPSNDFILKISATESNIKKIFFMAGNRHELVVKNRIRPNSENDYLWISDSKGNKMLYPLECVTI